MPDVKPLNQFPQTQTYDTAEDFFVIVRGATGEGPLLLTAGSVVTVSDGGGGGVGNVITVFGRDGVVIGQSGDYSADLIEYSADSSGLPATTVQEAIDVLSASGGGGGGPTGGSEGQIITQDGLGLQIWADPVVISVFGRDGAVEATSGDYHADQISEELPGGGDTTNRFVTAADLAKIALFSDERQQPAGGTTGQVLSKASNTDYDVEWTTPSVGGGGSISQIDLLPLAVPSASAPPTFKYVAGTGVWDFSQSGSDELRGQFLWPGGTPTLSLLYSCSVNSGNVSFNLYLMAVTAGDAQAVSSDSFDTVNVSTGAAVPGTAGYLGSISLSLTHADSAAAGDYIRWKLTRNTGVASNAAGTVTIHTANVTFA